MVYWEKEHMIVMVKLLLMADMIKIVNYIMTITITILRTIALRIKMHDTFIFMYFEIYKSILSPIPIFKLNLAF